MDNKTFSLPLPEGYSLYGLRSGISSAPGKKDLALFYSHRPASAAGVFTRNLVKAAPVQLSQDHLRFGKARAVIINSGCANACTGARGMADARWTVQYLAGALELPAREMLIASTGVIGRFLPRLPLKKGLDGLALAARAGKPSSAEDAVRAIMTTDTRPKTAAVSFSGRGRRFRVWGCAKGAGMIHPDMATMLSVILTDAGLPAADLRTALKWSVDRSFNRVSVDGDTSTNDSVFLLANGAAEPAAGVVRPAGGLLKSFRAALHQVCLSLANQVAADGEGATRTIWIFVEGARTEADAKRLAATVATSPLVKTAVHGADPNWGRVMAALGRAGVPFDPERVEIRFADNVVFRNGQATGFPEKKLHDILKRDKVNLRINLHQGKAWYNYVTCDFSKEYVSINADYTT